MKLFLILFLVTGIAGLSACKTHSGDKFAGKWITYKIDDGEGNVLKRSETDDGESIDQFNRLGIELKQLPDSADQYIFNFLGNKISMKKISETELTGIAQGVYVEYIPSNNHLILHMGDLTYEYERN
ncbi:MAG: hypothetical protein ABIY35_06625 [Chitinophagaceae bacterium]